MTSTVPNNRNLKLILFFLLSGFVLSQAYRTLGGILSVPLREEFSLDNHQLASIVGSFHIAFGCLQLLVGILVDCFGIRKTILAISPFTILGAVLSATATSPDALLWGQILLGFGCAPAFLVCMVLIFVLLNLSNIHMVRSFRTVLVQQQVLPR